MYLVVVIFFVYDNQGSSFVCLCDHCIVFLDVVLENNAVITQADKGRTLVMIYKEDYHNKVHTFLTNNNFQTIPKNPTNKYQKQITQTIKQCNVIFLIGNLTKNEVTISFVFNFLLSC